MANLINGKLSHDPIAKVSGEGEFLRPDSSFRNTITPNEVEKDRYHLFVSYACPWAHRTLIVRKLKKIEHIIDVSVTDAFMGDQGWTLSTEKDPRYLSELYVSSVQNYTGKITVPVLWDKKNRTIINNESSEIIRIFNSAFDQFTDSSIDLYPEHIQEQINEINDKVYKNVNNGVYRAGFASTQKAYEKAYDALFETLEELETYLKQEKFLTGNYLTEADIRLFTTLIRFDPVYYVHFKCNKNRIKDYPNLFDYLKCIYQIPEVKETCHFDHIKEHYYLSHKWINPSGIVPKGPDLSCLNEPHNRGEVHFWLRTH